MFGKVPVDVSKNIIARKMTIEVLRNCLSFTKQFRPSVISEIFERNYFEAIELQCKLLMVWGQQQQTISPEIKAMAQNNFHWYLHYIVIFQNNNKELAYQLIQNLAVTMGLLLPSHFKVYKTSPFLSYAEKRKVFETTEPKTSSVSDKYNPIINLTVSVSSDPLFRFTYPMLADDKKCERVRMTGNYAFNNEVADNFLYKHAYFQLLRQEENPFEFFKRGQCSGIAHVMSLALLALYPIKSQYTASELKAHRHFAEAMMSITESLKHPVKTGLKSIFCSDDFVTNLERALAADRKILEILLMRFFKGSNLFELPEKYAKRLFEHGIIAESENVDLINSVVNSNHANTFLTPNFIRHCIAVEERSETHPEGLRELLGLQLTNLMM